jgi:nitrite reductase/ring-hydroxylating ferredoxin subunit
MPRVAVAFVSLDMTIASVKFHSAAGIEEFIGTIPLRKEVNGWPLLMVRDGQEFHAFHNLCTHVRVRMNAARVVDGAIICPNHGARFDLRNGRYLGSMLGSMRDALAPLTRFETRVVGDRVEVALPPTQPGRRC